MHKILGILLIFILSGCATQPTTNNSFLQRSQYYKKSYPNGFCSVAVNTYYLSLNGKYPEIWAERTTNLGCGSDIETAREKAYRYCYYGCEIAFDISIASNQIIASWESFNLEQRQIKEASYAQKRNELKLKQIENLSKQCTSFGFIQATTSHSNCIMQLEIAGNLSAQMKESLDAQTQEMQKIRQQQALDSLNQSLKNLNRPANKPSVTCNRTFTGFICN